MGRTMTASMTRRRWMGAACCAGASLASVSRNCFAADHPAAIDVHHHVSPPAWLRDAAGPIAATNRNASAITGWTPARSLEEMDRSGVQVSVASITNPGVWFGEIEPARRLSRACSEYMAGLKQDGKGRFAGLVSPPLPDTEGSLREIAFGLDTLGLDGVGLLTNYDNKWLGDPSFAPVLAELNRRHATVFVHPTSSACCSANIPDVSLSAIEFPIDTTRTIVSLLFSGALAQYPDIKWIFSHAGGALPMLAQRVAQILESQPRLKERTPDGALNALKRLHYDLALAANPMAMGALTQLVASSQILFGSDFPLSGQQATLAGIDAHGFGAADLAAIRNGNARRLFPKLGT